MAENTESVSVSIRLRPMHHGEITKGAYEAWRAIEETSKTTQIVGFDNQKRALSDSIYAYDNVFPPQTTTADVYEQTAASIVKSVTDGYNGTIFAYGQTAAGKTYTMQGSEKEPGCLRLAINDIFQSIENSPDRAFLIRCSYLEIYCERIRDLLHPDTPEVKIREDPRKGPYVDCHEEIISNVSEIMSALHKGEEKRAVAGTDMNERSSRSHTIFRIVVESREADTQTIDTITETQSAETNVPSKVSQSRRNSSKFGNAVLVGELNLVDLAGSESVRTTNAAGKRLKEAGNINKSLLTLSRVINQLAQISNTTSAPESSMAHIAFRDSKLTRVLQKALAGNSRTSVICCVSPASLYWEETKSTLKFAASAKQISVRVSANEVLDDQAKMKRMQKELSRLKKELEAARLLANKDPNSATLVTNSSTNQALQDNCTDSTVSMDEMTTETVKSPHLNKDISQDIDAMQTEITPQDINAMQNESDANPSKSMDQQQEEEPSVHQETDKLVEYERLIETLRRQVLIGGAAARGVADGDARVRAVKQAVRMNRKGRKKRHRETWCPSISSSTAVAAAMDIGMKSIVNTPKDVVANKQPNGIQIQDKTRLNDALEPSNSTVKVEIENVGSSMQSKAENNSVESNQTKKARQNNQSAFETTSMSNTFGYSSLVMGSCMYQSKCQLDIDTMKSNNNEIENDNGDKENLNPAEFTDASNHGETMKENETVLAPTTSRHNGFDARQESSDQMHRVSDAHQTDPSSQHKTRNTLQSELSTLQLHETNAEFDRFIGKSTKNNRWSDSSMESNDSATTVATCQSHTSSMSNVSSNGTNKEMLDHSHPQDNSDHAICRQCETFSTQIQDLEERIVQKNQEIASVSHTAEEALSNNETLQKELEMAHQEIARVSHTAEEALSNNETLQKELEQANQTTEEIVSNNQTLQKELEHANQKTEEAVSNNQTLQKELEQANQTTKKALSNNETLQKELEQAKSEYAALVRHYEAQSELLVQSQQEQQKRPSYALMCVSNVVQTCIDETKLESQPQQQPKALPYALASVSNVVETSIDAQHSTSMTAIQEYKTEIKELELQLSQAHETRQILENQILSIQQIQATQTCATRESETDTPPFFAQEIESFQEKMTIKSNEIQDLCTKLNVIEQQYSDVQERYQDTLTQLDKNKKEFEWYHARIAKLEKAKLTEGQVQRLKQIRQERDTMKTKIPRLIQELTHAREEIQRLKLNNKKNEQEVNEISAGSMVEETHSIPRKKMDFTGTGATNSFNVGNESLMSIESNATDSEIRTQQTNVSQQIVPFNVQQSILSASMHSYHSFLQQIWNYLEQIIDEKDLFAGIDVSLIQQGDLTRSLETGPLITDRFNRPYQTISEAETLAMSQLMEQRKQISIQPQNLGLDIASHQPTLEVSTLPTTHEASASKETTKFDVSMDTMHDKEAFVQSMKQQSESIKRMLESLVQVLCIRLEHISKDRMRLLEAKHTLREHVDELKQQLSTSQETFTTKHATETISLQNEIDRLQSDYDELHVEKTQKDAELIRISELVETFETKNTQLEQESKKLQTELDNVRDELANYQHSQSIDKEEIDTLKNRIQVLEGELEQTQDEYRRGVQFLEQENLQLMVEIRTLRQSAVDAEQKVRTMTYDCSDHTDTTTNEVTMSSAPRSNSVDTKIVASHIVQDTHPQPYCEKEDEDGNDEKDDFGYTVQQETELDTNDIDYETRTTNSMDQVGKPHHPQTSSMSCRNNTVVIDTSKSSMTLPHDDTTDENEEKENENHDARAIDMNPRSNNLSCSNSVQSETQQGFPGSTPTKRTLMNTKRRPNHGNKTPLQSRDVNTMMNEINTNSTRKTNHSYKKPLRRHAARESLARPVLDLSGGEEDTTTECAQQ